MKFSIYILLILSIGALALRSKAQKKKDYPEFLEVDHTTVLLPHSQEPTLVAFTSINLKLLSTTPLGYSFTLDNRAKRSDKIDEILMKYFVKQGANNYILPFYYIRKVNTKVDTGIKQLEYLSIDIAASKENERAVFNIYFKYGEGRKNRNFLYDLLNNKKLKVDSEMSQIKQEIKNIYEEYQKGKSYRRELKNKTLDKTQAIKEHNEKKEALIRQSKEIQKKIEQLQIDLSKLESQIDIEISNKDALTMKIKNEENHIQVLKGDIDTSKYDILNSKTTKPEIKEKMKEVIKKMETYIPQEKTNFWISNLDIKKTGLQGVEMEVSQI